MDLALIACCLQKSYVYQKLLNPLKVSHHTYYPNLPACTCNFEIKARRETVNLHYIPAVSSLWLEKQSCIWTKPNTGLLLPPAEDRREVGQAALAPPRACDLNQAELLGFPVSMLAAFQSCLQACSSGCCSCQHTRQHFLKWHLKSDSSTSSTLCFAPYVTLLLCFFSVSIYYKHLHKDMSQLGTGLLLLGCVRLFCQTAKT